MFRKVIIFNQHINPRDLQDTPAPHISMSSPPYVPLPPPPPSRFRRKKGYTGLTAQHCNKNYKRMPPGF